MSYYATPKYGSALISFSQIEDGEWLLDQIEEINDNFNNYRLKEVKIGEADLKAELVAKINGRIDVDLSEIQYKISLLESEMENTRKVYVKINLDDLSDDLRELILNSQYVHPANHPASMIIEDDERKFVHPEDKEYWDNKVDKIELEKYRLKDEKITLDDLDENLVELLTNNDKIIELINEKVEEINTKIEDINEINDTYETRISVLEGFHNVSHKPYFIQTIENDSVIPTSIEYIEYKIECDSDVFLVDASKITSNIESFDIVVSGKTLKVVFDSPLEANKQYIIKINPGLVRSLGGQVNLDTVNTIFSTSDTAEKQVEWEYTFVLPISTFNYNFNNDENFNHEVDLDDIYGPNYDGKNSLIEIYQLNDVDGDFEEPLLIPNFMDGTQATDFKYWNWDPNTNLLSFGAGTSFDANIKIIKYKY